MTFLSLIYKMFQADVKRYRLFILCNLSAIAILYNFLSIAQNQQFMNAKVVDPMISSNIYAPTFLVLLFSGIFIPYSQNAFMKSRKKDYGILQTLGMTEKDVLKSVLIENTILCAVALIGGLIIGTILSVFFIGFIRNIIGINELNISVSVKSYEVTIVYTLVIFGVSLLINILDMIKSTIVSKIKFAEKAEISVHHSWLFIVFGIVSTAISFALMLFLFKQNSNIWLISILFCVCGSLLLFFHGEVLVETLKTKFYKKYTKYLFLLSDIRYYYGKNKKIFFVNTWLLFTIQFIMVFSLLTYPSFSDNATKYHPYDMDYTEVDDFFQPLSDKKIELIAKNNNNGIVSSDTVEFVRNGSFTVFCVDDINKTLKKNYKVEPNSFVLVFPYYLNDGYEHTLNNITDINIESQNDEKQFVEQDTLIDPLFGQISSITDKIILVNKSDFEWISSYGVDYKIKGNLHLYNFKNWKDSYNIVSEITTKLLEINPTSKGDDFYSVSSRIVAYRTAIRSSYFLIFVVIYACCLLYFAAIIMIHFKLKMEYNNEEKKYFGLYRIGIREDEIKKIISQKIAILYFVSFLYATIMNVIYSYYTNCTYGYGRKGIHYALLTALGLFALHFIVYKLYSRNYYKTVINTMF